MGWRLSVAVDAGLRGLVTSHPPAGGVALLGTPFARSPRVGAFTMGAGLRSRRVHPWNAPGGYAYANADAVIGRTAPSSLFHSRAASDLTLEREVKSILKDG
jgi:hypothetical protein